MRRNLINNDFNAGVNCELQTDFQRFLLRSVPRLLTQLDRDPDSPSFGCFDRDYWHYRIRDFSSIVLQQGMVVLQTLYSYQHEDNFLYREPKVITWIDASLHFWASQQLPSGSFNEYYPFEEGFPPTAFSLFAVGLIFRMRDFPLPEPPIASATQRAVDWLLLNQESQALNQEAVALVALTLASRISSIRVDQSRLESRLVRFFSLQSAEGWFAEYGGADTGYLSVTLDALAVYFDITGDNRAEAAMQQALEYLAAMIAVSGTTPVMTNSRNTDYIVPYGLVRLAERSPLAVRVIEVLFSNLDAPDHFLHATDDRYLCHYIYQSCFRGLESLPRLMSQKERLPCEKDFDRYYCEAGIHVRHVPGKRSIFTAAGKGGIYYVYTPAGISCADYGWRYRGTDGRAQLTHWQHPEIRVVFARIADSTIIDIEGAVTSHAWLEATPFRHFALRVLSYLFGNRIIARLKRALIFKAESCGIQYRRRITIHGTGLTCVDSFSGCGIDSFEPLPAPPYSLRHVASAANFTREELSAGLKIARVSDRTKESLTIKSFIDFPE